MAKLRVLLADDHAVVREGLRSLIDAQPDLEVVGEASDGYPRADRPRNSSRTWWSWTSPCRG